MKYRIYRCANEDGTGPQDLVRELECIGDEAALAECRTTEGPGPVIAEAQEDGYSRVVAP